ncbi:MAG: NAD-binding protein, partial [Chloroflexia bacterium]|nr:NAD-binding protein [Chloroflexia bacterium]
MNDPPHVEKEAGMTRLDGLNIAVTGGAGDIGAAMGAEFRRLGANVTLIDRKPPEEA